MVPTHGCTAASKLMMTPIVKLERLKLHACKKCSKAFLNAEDLEKHMSPRVILKRIKIFSCELCNYACCSIKDYHFHSLEHVREERFENRYNESKNVSKFKKTLKCEHCDYKFVERSTLETHSILHNMPYICNKCGIGYFKKDDRDAHLKLVHPSRPKDIKKKPIKAKIKAKSKRSPKDKTNDHGKVTCPVCNKIYANKNSFDIHMRIHNNDKRYKCDTCGKAFVQHTALKIHTKIHTGVKDYLCKYCNKAFRCYTNVTNHERIHTNSKPYVCSYCKKSFSDPAALKRHLRTHTGEKPYACDLCPNKYGDASQLLIHKKRHLGEKNHICDICDKAFLTASNLRLHLDVHIGRNKFFCDYCGKGSITKNNLAGHILRMHTNSSDCDKCGKRFISESDLKRHKSKSCKPRKQAPTLKCRQDENGNFICPKCPKVFELTSSLKSHMSTHVKKKFACDTCPSKFSSANCLAKHIGYSHTKYECEFCIKVYSHEPDLRQHVMRAHYGVRPFKCVYCSKSYASEGTLKSHLKEHTGETRFHCKKCPEIFDKKRDLLEHRQQIHRDFFCDICEKFMSSEGSLRLHLLTHSGLEKYECHDCGEKYILKGSLKHHIVNLHLNPNRKLRFHRKRKYDEVM